MKGLLSSPGDVKATVRKGLHDDIRLRILAARRRTFHHRTDQRSPSFDTNTFATITVILA